MPDLYMDVDSALAEVPINLFPLLDDTDFKSIEDSLTYDQAGLDLVWNFVTTAGAMSQTEVTPTTGGGDYDWTAQGNGMYSIAIPDSGGADINNDTEGFGWFTGVATGVLPWRGPVICFRAAQLNNSMIDGATVDVNVTAMADIDLSATQKASVNAEVVDALGTDTLAELGVAAPSATPTIKQAIMLLYMALRNESLTTSALLSIKNDAGTVITKKALSDDTSTFTAGELVAGDA